MEDFYPNRFYSLTYIEKNALVIQKNSINIKDCIEELSSCKESEPSQNLSLGNRIASLIHIFKTSQSSKMETGELLN